MANARIMQWDGTGEPVQVGLVTATGAGVQVTSDNPRLAGLITDLYVYDPLLQRQLDPRRAGDAARFVDLLPAALHGTYLRAVRA